MFEYLEKRKVTLVYLPLILYWILLLIFTSLPAKDLPSIGVYDKFEHLGAFFGLSVLLSLGFLYQNKYPLLKKYFWLSAFLIICFYGFLDEIHQLYVPGRDCDILDWTSDAIGALAGTILVKYLLKIFKYKSGLAKI
ncbi:VanZ family protein [bacterium BMS3Abin03]|nr:VanZ family protein [bacterium BMS3Abin03]